MESWYAVCNHSSAAGNCTAVHFVWFWTKADRSIWTVWSRNVQMQMVFVPRWNATNFRICLDKRATIGSSAGVWKHYHDLRNFEKGTKSTNIIIEAFIAFKIDKDFISNFLSPTRRSRQRSLISWHFASYRFLGLSHKTLWRKFVWPLLSNKRLHHDLSHRLHSAYMRKWEISGCKQKSAWEEITLSERFRVLFNSA